MATYTGTNAIDEFRRYTQDTAAPFRVDATAALGLVNQAQRMLSVLLPTAFLQRQSVNLVQGCRQTKPHPRSKMCSVVEASNGSTVTPVSKQLMDSLNAGWMQDTAAAVVQHQVIFPEDTENFYVYPPQPATPSTAVVVSEITPSDVAAAGDVLEVEDRYFMAIPFLMAHLHYLEDAGVEANAVMAKDFLQQAYTVIKARE